MKKLVAISTVTAAFFLALAAGCGGGSTYTCCLNGKFFSCTSVDAANKCGLNSDTSGCTADPSKDAPAGSNTCKTQS